MIIRLNTKREIKSTIKTFNSFRFGPGHTIQYYTGFELQDYLAYQTIDMIGEREIILQKPGVDFALYIDGVKDSSFYGLHFHSLSTFSWKEFKKFCWYILKWWRR